MTLVGPAYWASVALAAVFHEMAHLTVAWVSRVRVKKLGLSWHGPYIVRDPGSPMQNTIISLAGPGLNLLLGLLFWRSLPTFAFVNGLLALLNLLPIRSSDGMRVYRIWLQPMKATVKSQRSAAATWLRIRAQR